MQMNQVQAGVAVPQQGFGRVAARPEEILLICHYDPAGISTVIETVAYMQSASRYSVSVLNFFEHRLDGGWLRLNPLLDLERFDAVVIHNTVSYNPANVRSLDEALGTKLRDYGGVKVLMKQDENFRFRELAQAMGEIRFDLVLTCLPPEAVALVYPPQVVGSTRFERMLTGYVTPTLRSRGSTWGARPIDIGYRGSIQPLNFGWLAYEKRKIGSDVLARLAGRKDLVLDISSRWEDRLGGDAWFAFLTSCKATLGAESGASIFDLDGDLDARCAALEEKYAGLPEDERAEAVLAGIADLECNVRYHQVSPRHFEAAAWGTVQLLYPGAYSGLLTAGRHYFELARDCSNLDEAVDLIRDERRRSEMARCAFKEVVMERGNWIESFVERLDGWIGEELVRKGRRRAPAASAQAAVHALVLAASEQAAEAAGALVPAPAALHSATCPPDADAVRLRVGGRALPPSSVSAGDMLPPLAQLQGAGARALEIQGAIERLLELPEPARCAELGVPPALPATAALRERLEGVLFASEQLARAALGFRGLHAVVAADFSGLVAGAIARSALGVRLLAARSAAEVPAGALEGERACWAGWATALSAQVDTWLPGAPEAAFSGQAQRELELFAPDPRPYYASSPQSAPARQAAARGRKASPAGAAATVAPDRPKVGLQAVGRRPERVLVVCDYDPRQPGRIGAATAALQRASAYPLTIFNARSAGEGGIDALLAGQTAWKPDAFDALMFCIAPGAQVPELPALAGVAAARVLLWLDAPATPHLAFHAQVSLGEATPAALDEVDAAIARALGAAARLHGQEWVAPRAGRNVLLIVPHRPKLDPRLGWTAQGAKQPLMIHQLGLHEDGGPVQVQVASNGALVRSVPRIPYQPGEVAFWRAWAPDTEGATVAIELLAWMEQALATQVQSDDWLRLIGATVPTIRSANMHDMFRYCLDISATLLRDASRMRNIDAVIAADVPALPAAHILGALFGVPVVFDAHEYWPQADLGNADFEEQFWEIVERRLVRPAALRATVSTGLAELMGERYGVPFLVLPNAEPLSSLHTGPAGRPDDGVCQFLFQGGFARGRGLELLIRAWPRVDPKAHLVLRGMDGEYRQRLIREAAETGLLDQRIFFPPAVDESEMIRAAAAADVGLVPYEPHGFNHKHCCPNKLSQYMAAGLPLLANATAFVSEVVQAADGGLAVDFADQDALVAAVDSLTRDADLRRRFAANARAHFERRFNWDALSAPYYAELVKLCAHAPVRALQLFEERSGLPLANPRPPLPRVHVAIAPVQPAAPAPAPVEETAASPEVTAQPVPAETAAPPLPVDGPVPTPVPVAPAAVPVASVAAAAAVPPPVVTRTAIKAAARGVWRHTPEPLRVVARPILRPLRGLLRRL